MKRKRLQARNRTSPGRRPISLLTDFGSADHYAGTMKGTILSLNPRATIVDLSHEVAPYDIREAGYLLWASYRFFPADTIFVCVVDPGVGSGRRIISVQSGGQTMVAPDNGLLDFILLEEDITNGYEILQPEMEKVSTISSTFHGRDIIAPFAARLSLGKSVRTLVRPVRLSRPSSPFYDAETGRKTARILHIDRFGNLVTNIPRRYFHDSDIAVGSARISRHVSTFSEVREGEVSKVVGSSGLVEIVARES
ncbi:MAG TPA: SAM-dependent chlorinase/fluorinase, partial [Bacteroidota bacterium]|nr:SAM-dependent chlorinase/fluorinase [Bacteroidota bacterium]